MKLNMYAGDNGTPSPHRSTIFCVVLAVLAAACLLLAGLGYAGKLRRIPSVPASETMTGTVERTQVVRGEHQTFGIVLQDGRLVWYADGSPKYRQVTEAVKAGSAVSMLVRPIPGGADLLAIAVDGRSVVSVRDAAQPYRDGIRVNHGIAMVSGTVGLTLLGSLAILIWRPPHRGQRRPGAV